MKLDLILRWNAFHYRPKSCSLLQAARGLFFSLIEKFNQSYWKEWILVENLCLMGSAKINSKNTFNDMRMLLIENKIIDYKKGARGKPPEYRVHTDMISDYIKRLVPKNEPNSSTNHGTNNRINDDEKPSNNVALSDPLIITYNKPK